MELFDVLVCVNSCGGEQASSPNMGDYLDTLKIYSNRLLRKFGYRRYFDVQDPNFKRKQMAAEKKKVSEDCQ